MSSRPLSVLYPATRGMDMRDDYSTFTPNQAGRFVEWSRNMRIQNGYWRTRYPIHEIALSENSRFHDSPWQGALIYQPNSGQGVAYQGVGDDRIVGSYGGRLYEISVETGEVCDVSGEDFQVGDNWLPAHLEQAENYVIRTDGASPTKIWNGKEAVFFSPGYNKRSPKASAVPNQAGPIRYLKNRLWTSAYGRRLYAGDVLHELEPESPIDVLRYRDQTYDYTSQWFAPEARQGDTVAISLMKVGGVEYVVMHGDNMGMTGIRQGVPRPDWPNENMKFVISNETAAAGPYAFAEGDWRLLFRSRRGIEETRFVLAEDNTVGGTAINLGKQIAPLLDSDIEPFLLFSSLINPPSWERTMTTLAPRVRSGHAWHRGIAVMNRNPENNIEPGAWAWEGVTTLPCRMGNVQQLLDGRVNGRQRVFALTQKENGNGLVEFRKFDGLDRLADGTSVRQNGALRTRKISAGSEYLETSYDEIAFLIRNIHSDVDFELYVRDEKNPEFKLHHRGSACKAECGKCDKCCNSYNGELFIPAGTLNRESRWVQFHVETWGVASFDFVMQHGEQESLDQKRSKNNKFKECERDCFGIFDYIEKE